MKSLKINSSIENIRLVENFIDNAKEQYRFDEDIYGNIIVAVTESVNNAIVHGNKNDASKFVQISLETRNNQLRFLIKDEGKGFNPKDLPDPTAPENLDKIGGRGIFLMQHLSDEVNFTENGRVVELIFNYTTT